MKILVISQQWDPEEGTPQRRWGQLVDHLTAMGDQVRVIAAPPHYPGGELTSPATDHAPGAVGVGGHGELIWRSRFAPHGRSLTSRVWDQAVVAFSSGVIALSVTRRWRPDIILTTAPPLPPVLVTCLIGRFRRIPYVVDLRDVWPDILAYMNEWGSRAEANPRNLPKAAAFDALIALGGKLFSVALRRSDGIVTTTPSFAEKLRRAGHSDVLNVRNMASVRDQRVAVLEATSPADARAPRTIRVLYTGTTGRAQGLESALEAVRLAREAGTDIQLRVVGSGSHLRLLELQVQKNGLPVEFYGRIPFDEVLEQYEWCDTTLVSLRKWRPLSYTVPSKLYEALSVGRHITVAADGESARIVAETGAGDAVPSMDPRALAELWTELSVERDRLNVGELGRAWLLARETPEENAAKFRSFVQRIASSNARKSRDWTPSRS